MTREIRRQGKKHNIFYIAFALVSFILIMLYASNTLIHFTTPQQFPISSFERFPLTYLIFPAELFSFLFAIYFVYNLTKGNSSKIRPRRLEGRKDPDKRVAILIPTYNEPYQILKRTLESCKNIRWKAGKRIYVLDDSTNEEDKHNVRKLCRKYGATLIRRNNREGFKAGIINHAIKNHIKENYFAIFDSDQAPVEGFLEKTMDHFSDPEVGFVQSPQNYINGYSPLERAQQLGTNIFYQAQCVSKSTDKAMPFCGTNLVIRRDVFEEVGGFSYYTATEDIEIGLRMNEAGYHGAFVPNVLVNGFGTTSFSAYASQQYRWANGNLAILRKNFLKILFGKFSLRQQIHYLFTLGWWVIGIVSMIYIIVPIIALFYGGTHHTWLPSAILILIFLNVVLGLGMIYASLNNRLDDDRITFKDALLQYSLISNSMFIYGKAALNALVGRYIGFVRTDKSKKRTSFWEIKWNLVLAGICFSFSIYSLYMAMTAGSMQQVRTYLPTSIWLMFYTTVLASSILFVGNIKITEINPYESKVPSFLKERIEKFNMKNKTGAEYVK